MPALPTLQIDNSDAWNRLLTAFHNNPEEYKQWLKEAIRDEVERRERKEVAMDADEQVKVISVELKGLMDSAR